LDAGPDARAETYPFEPGCRVEFSVQPSAPEVADGQSYRYLDADGTGHGGGTPHAFDFRVDGRASANTPGAAVSRPRQNFDETARKVILSLVSRRRPASVRTKFQSRSYARCRSTNRRSARASSPIPGTCREMRTEPSRMR